jgi:hypothetical protein
MMSVILLYPFASFATLYYDRGDETNATAKMAKM